MTSKPGQLAVVSTPIGNLGDLSPRAAEILATADILACEDTRMTRKLLALSGRLNYGKFEMVNQKLLKPPLIKSDLDNI